eukprot:CAMPEP_0185818250 /NCGR_PEP_ID=MMETSP1322-20130828/20340_1 /TAXON_ID=265543 /ORGANISM="Minutocellus polymorphus, Strain RCC2270" /LENGTH=82 /DNA_ID=CAMNT_0028515345 /DNA_START=9 /DNA_END=254 /DNA_ORIENTATION=-
MWSALRTDLKEFVSTVAEDTNGVLTKIDSKLTDEEKRRGIATPARDGAEDTTTGGAPRPDAAGGDGDGGGLNAMIGTDGDIV